MKKILVSLILSLIPINTYADNNISSGFSITNSSIIYSKNSTKFGNITGGYGYINFEKNHFFELASNFTYLNSQNNFYMENILFSYSNFQLDNNALKIGGQIINSSLNDKDQGFILSFEDKYNFFDNFSTSFESHLSFYNYYTDFKPIYQLNPSITFEFGDFYSSGQFFLTLKGYYINLPEELPAGIIIFKRNYFSSEASLSYNYFNILNLKLYSWLGSQVFAVRDNGFSVYNSTDEHNAGYGFLVKYALTEDMSISMGINNEYFKERSTKNNSSTISIPVFINYSF